MEQDTLVACEAAAQAQRQADWVTAERLWREIREAHPHVCWAYTGGATAVRGLGRDAEADGLLEDAVARFPAEPAVRHEVGHVAAGRGYWTAAEAHWRAALSFGGQAWWVYTELAGALEQQGRIAEAEAILLQGQAEDPGEISLFTYHARLAWQREDWAAAVTRWAAVRQRFPITEEVSSGLYQALLRLAEYDPAAADAVDRDLEPSDATDDMRSVLLRFESLGGSGPDGGCEFGSVQREHGAEPLGLFRWATVTPASLIGCLEARFAGIGEAETTKVYVHDDDPAFWQIGETSYGTSMHSFVPFSEVPHEQMVALARRRMGYLKEKLVADLENAAKILVLKLAGRLLTLAEADALGRAIRSYGPGELLCVCAADAEHPAGWVTSAAPGVFVGYIDFSGRLDVVARHAEWEALCRTMLAVSAAP